jgi:hypothetical protein
MGDTVRFTELVQTCGRPEVYLPLADPKQDRNFIQAIKEQRVLSLKQQPTGTKKDFGTVGFLPEKHVSYLIFPKPLTAFAERRIIGIKYDTLQQANVSTPRARVLTRGRITRPRPPSPKPKPRPKRFRATVRLTSTKEVTVIVEGFSQDEARRKAEKIAREKNNTTSARTKSEVVSLSEASN